ncbi:hypothetical protein [Streptomyces sp. NPDC002619]|uniref:hypothetical protein n=1 Tax=Streptomyces sp. NPDC002619 TaxID=3364655 RepID=UPI00368F8A59
MRIVVVEEVVVARRVGRQVGILLVGRQGERRTAAPTNDIPHVRHEFIAVGGSEEQLLIVVDQTYAQIVHGAEPSLPIGRLDLCLLRPFTEDGRTGRLDHRPDQREFCPVADPAAHLLCLLSGLLGVPADFLRSHVRRDRVVGARVEHGGDFLHTKTWMQEWGPGRRLPPPSVEAGMSAPSS